MLLASLPGCAILPGAGMPFPDEVEGQTVAAAFRDARHVPTHYNLARSFELNGDGTRAVEHYGRFLENSGAENADLVELVRSRIAELNGRVRR